jgi:acylphosphatase
MRRVPLVVRGWCRAWGFARAWRASHAGLGLGGRVRNDSGSVFSDVERTDAVVARVIAALRDEAPPLAVIDEVTAEEPAPVGKRRSASEASSVAVGRRTSILDRVGGKAPLTRRRAAVAPLRGQHRFQILVAGEPVEHLARGAAGEPRERPADETAKDARQPGGDGFPGAVERGAVGLFADQGERAVDGGSLRRKPVLQGGAQRVSPRT